MNKNKLWILFLVVQLLIGISVDGQNSSSKEVLIAQQENTHVISKGETIFSICRKYDCTQKELLTVNPQLVNGLKAGMVLNIPVKEDSKSVTKEKKDKKSNKNNDSKKKDYIFHKVESQETFFSYYKKYGVTQEELISINPDLKKGLKVGMIIKIPAQKKYEPEIKKHIVEKGETLYRITNIYGVTIDDLKEWNPVLSQRELNAGDTLIIKKYGINEQENISFSKSEPAITEVKKAEQQKAIEGSSKVLIKPGKGVFRITMFLPLNYQINDSLNKEALSSEEFAYNDSISKTDQNYNYSFLKNKKERSLYGPTRNFLSFYEGFILALDSMSNAGMKIRLDAYDCRSGQYVIDSVIKHTDVVNSDLIVGPIDVKQQKAIAAYCYKNQIPFVSPLSGDDDLVANNPFYFQVNPTKDYILRKTADYIGNEFYDKNFIILSLGGYEQVKEADLEKMVRSKFSSRKSSTGTIKEVDFTGGGKQGYWEIKDDLKKDIENVIFIPAPKNKTEREALLSRAINSLYTLSKDYDITLIGMSDYLNLKSINTEYYHRLKLQILTPNFIDYNDEDVKKFIKKYRERYLTEPNQYSYRGYDIAVLFSSAYNKFGSNYIEKISGYHPKTIQSYLDFNRIKDLSGFSNKSLFIVNYTPDYEIKVISRIN